MQLQWNSVQTLCFDFLLFFPFNLSNFKIFVFSSKVEIVKKKSQNVCNDTCQFNRQTQNAQTKSRTESVSLLFELVWFCFVKQFEPEQNEKEKKNAIVLSLSHASTHERRTVMWCSVELSQFSSLCWFVLTHRRSEKRQSVGEEWSYVLQTHSRTKYFRFFFCRDQTTTLCLHNNNNRTFDENGSCVCGDDNTMLIITECPTQYVVISVHMCRNSEWNDHIFRRENWNGMEFVRLIVYARWSRVSFLCVFAHVCVNEIVCGQLQNGNSRFAEHWTQNENVYHLQY